MTVTYSLELKLVLDDDDSAEKFRRDIEKSVSAEWVRENGESITVRTKTIDR